MEMAGNGVIYQPTDEDRAAYAGMSVVIVTPCGSYANPFRFTRSVTNLIVYSWQQGLKVDAFGGTERMVVHWARNELATQARDKICERTGKNYTHILWLDDDHTFNPDMLCYLARDPSKDIVSALYFGRQQHLPVAYVKDKNPSRYSHYPLIWPPATICEVDAVGFGACLMRRDVLERMPDPWFAFTPEVGEDIYFCTHAKERGIKIWLEGRYSLGHIGDPEIIGRAQYEKYVKDNEVRFGPKIKVALGGQ